MILNTEIILSIFSPVIGAVIGILRKPSPSVLYHMLAFSGGIMLGVTFLDLIPDSIYYSSSSVCIYGLIIGFFIMYLLKLIIPESNSIKSKAYYLASGMAVHHFSEGIAIAITATINPKISFIVAMSIAVHNIAKGLCTSGSIYFSVRNKYKAFILTCLTAFPLYLGYMLIQFFIIRISTPFLGLLLSISAGIMLYITTAELIPASSNKKSNYATMFSLISGIIMVMALEYC